jgi:hypothetical protein
VSEAVRTIWRVTGSHTPRWQGLAYSAYMQLNIYVPRDGEPVLQRLDRVSRTTGRTKSDIVLEAIRTYLDGLDCGRRLPELRTFDLGRGTVPPRSELYGGGRPD